MGDERHSLNVRVGEASITLETTSSGVAVTGIAGVTLTATATVLGGAYLAGKYFERDKEKEKDETPRTGLFDLLRRLFTGRG